MLAVGHCRVEHVNEEYQAIKENQLSIMRFPRLIDFIDMLPHTVGVERTNIGTYAFNNVSISVDPVDLALLVGQGMFLDSTSLNLTELPNSDRDFC